MELGCHQQSLVLSADDSCSFSVILSHDGISQSLMASSIHLLTSSSMDPLSPCDKTQLFL